MNKGETSTFIILSILIGATIVTLITSSLISNKSPIVSNPRAITCPATQCTGTSSCYPIGHYDTTSKLTCCAAHANCNNTTYNWATWGSNCTCSGPTPTRTLTPRPTSPPLYRSPTPTTPGPIAVACCRQDPIGYDCPAGYKEIRYVGKYYDNCASANNSYGFVSTCSSLGYPNLTSFVCIAPPTPTPTRTPTSRFSPTRTPTRSSTPPTGASATKTPTPSVRANPTATIPSAQVCRLGVDTYTIGQSYCDETNNIVKKCLGNNNWQTSPNPCGGSKCTNDLAGHSYSCAAKCEAYDVKGGNKFRIAFLPENYTSIITFRSVVKDAVSSIRSTNLGNLINKMDFYIVTDLSETYHNTPRETLYNDFVKIHNTGQSVCGANISVVIDNPNSSIGCASLGSAIKGLGGYSCGVYNLVVPHELAHAAALLDDEYIVDGADPNMNDNINCSKKYSGSPSQPCAKWSGMSGVGCIAGCYHSSWYRSTETSIMKDDGIKFFNPPSLKGWQEVLKDYQ